MLRDIVKHTDLKGFDVTFTPGQILFLEGDDSQDLYILTSGTVDILKGKKKIAEITEPGALFGEMSFFMGTARTATVKAAGQVGAVCIPKNESSTFLHKFPEVAREIATLLAQRLDESNQIHYGLKEFCDQLPDAVLTTDREGKILSWNTAAEELYGRTWNDIRYTPAEELFRDITEYRAFFQELNSKHSVAEKSAQGLTSRQGNPVRVPENPRSSTTATTIPTGWLSVSRDVTTTKTLERRYRRVKRWLVPLCVLAAATGGAAYYYHPSMPPPSAVSKAGTQELRNQLAKDYFLLKALLNEPFGAGGQGPNQHGDAKILLRPAGLPTALLRIAPAGPRQDGIRRVPAVAGLP